MIHTPEEFARAVLNITAGNVAPSPVDIHHAAGLVAARDAAIRAATLKEQS